MAFDAGRSENKVLSNLSEAIGLVLILADWGRHVHLEHATSVEPWTAGCT